MSNKDVKVPIEKVTISSKKTVAIIGNPNSGKSTIFNRLTGLKQYTANYSGVTVEKHFGKVLLNKNLINIVDLPGTYSLYPYSEDEKISVDVLKGNMEGTPSPDVILAVVDITKLYQSLFLIQQLIEIGKPLLIAFSMIDTAANKNLHIDLKKLVDKLGNISFCKVNGTTGEGISKLKKLLIENLDKNTIVDNNENGVNIYENKSNGLVSEIRNRYKNIKLILSDTVKEDRGPKKLYMKLTSWINQPIQASILFLTVMATIFQAVFSWANPLMDLIDNGANFLITQIETYLPTGMLSSFLADGIIAGVGSVIIFLPQILILSFFIIMMEDTGYLARAAFLVDKVMKSAGLSGQSVIPMLSGFACAVPAIMGTRIIPNERDRIATILAIPFMTCSARLPIYALLIAAFVPNTQFGFLNLQGIVLFGLYLLGAFGGIFTALLLKKTSLKGQDPTFILSLPEFHLPNIQTVFIKMLDRAMIFMKRAGTVIFLVAVLIWLLAYFPRSEEIESQRDLFINEAELYLENEELVSEINRIENEFSAQHLAQSYLGRSGQIIEPIFKPIGWDWKISAAVIAGFPAREVVIAVLGTIYAVGSEADEASLAIRLKSATWPDNTPVFTLPMVLGMLVFYAWCMQCAATLAIMKRETNTWKWPLFSWAYMSILGYVGAMAIYYAGNLILS
jgi:ferrous iron transport protein B